MFPDPAMTVAAFDRLVHHAVIVEMNVGSYRQREASAAKANSRTRTTNKTPKTGTNNKPDIG